LAATSRYIGSNHRQGSHIHRRKNRNPRILDNAIITASVRKNSCCPCINATEELSSCDSPKSDSLLTPISLAVRPVNEANCISFAPVRRAKNNDARLQSGHSASINKISIQRKQSDFPVSFLGISRNSLEISSIQMKSRLFTDEEWLAIEADSVVKDT
jgi:hypothetical protein